MPLIYKILLLVQLFGFLQCFIDPARDSCKMDLTRHGLICSRLNSTYMPSEMFLTYDDDVANFLSNLRYLEFKKSNISTLQNQAFQKSPLLSQIILRDVSLTTIEQRAFEGLTSVKWLDISHNLIKTVPKDALTSTNVRHLTLDGNSNLEIPTNESLFSSRRLLWLSMKKCNVMRLSETAFADNHALSYIDLSHNQLQFLPRKIFIPLVHLIYVDLSYNRFQTIDISIFNKLSHYPLLPSSVILDNNPWYCDCRLKPLISWTSKNVQDNTWRYVASLTRARRTVMCHEPQSLAGIFWENLRDSEISC